MQWPLVKQLAQRILAKHPLDMVANAYIAQALRESGDFKTALFYAERAVQVSPTNSDLLYELGLTRWKLEEFDNALDIFRRVIDMNPAALHARIAMCKIYDLRSQFDEMIAMADETIAMDPTNVPLRCARAVALASSGRSDEAAIAACQTLLEYPSDPEVAELACFCHNYVSGFSRQRVFEVHKNYGRLIAQTAPDRPAIVHTPRDPDRKIRVGVISADLRLHSVSAFIEPFFRHYDKSRFYVMAFGCGAPQDAVTQRLKGYVDKWYPGIETRHDQMASAIRAAAPDILIDLHGITLGHMQNTLFLRAAPIQATYIGYPNTTGNPSIDYRFVDSLTDPPGSADAFATEKLIRLDPCFLCYEPRPDMTPEPRHAALVNAGGTPRPITFASFNATYKINDQVIQLWKRVVDAVPGSRLVIKSGAIRNQRTQQAMRRAFERNGWDPARLDVRIATPMVVDHMAAYNEIDIALDTFPYHGTTTTCEALIMGVPVVTLVGEAHASRVGLSLLTNAGMPELAATNEGEFVQIAKALAADRSRLAALHQTLRDRVLGSRLCNATDYCRRLESALVSIWQTYCTSPQ